jgi:two-component system CheB/CheR fusion protein
VATEARRRVYAFAIVLVGAVLVIGLQLAVGPRLGLHAPFALLILTVTLSSAYGGLAPGLIATGLGALAAVRLMVPSSADPTGAAESRLGLALFIIVGLGLTLLGNVVREARNRAEEAARSASRDREQMLREIAERRKGEAAHRLLASIVQSSDDAIYGKSLDGVITSWNAAAERLFGYTAEEALGQPSTILTPADRVGEQSAVLVPNHEIAQHFETVRRRKDGTIIHVSTSISPVRNESGVLVGSSTIARDITPQKLAEEGLRRAQEQLREADRRKDEFLAILAHELRNPLAPLRNALEILKGVDAGAATALEARNVAERQVHHLARLVDDLLDVSRITHGRIELQKERVELQTVVKNAVETARGAIDASGHDLTVSLPEEPLWFEGDEVRLVQILSNLLNNAAQYTGSGGKIALHANRFGESVEIRVSDTGLGIAPEALPRVFDMFTQVSPKEARTSHSLGIGLRLVKGLVEMHGGRVEALSAGTGRGSVFVVRLPLASPDLFRPAETLPPLNAPRVKRRVLIVDDNPDAALSLATLLSLEGHDTRVASDGAAALETLGTHDTDAVLLDIGLPGMDGYEVARRVRRDPALARIKLVALTGWGQDHDRERARAAGFDHHLTKPVEPGDLFRVIL